MTLRCLRCAHRHGSCKVHKEVWRTVNWSEAECGTFADLDCKVCARAAGKARKELDGKARSDVPLQCLSFEILFLILKDDRTVEKTRHCIDREDVFPMKQWKNVVQNSDSKLEESLLNDWDEVTIDFAADDHGTPVLYLTGKSVASEGGAGRSDLCDSKPHQYESKTTDGDSVKEVEEPRPPLRRSRQVTETSVCIKSTVMVAVENNVTYEEAMKGNEKNE